MTLTSQRDSCAIGDETSAPAAETRGAAPEDLHRRAARGGALVLATQGLRFTLQIGATMVLARLLAPADFGLVAMAGSLTALFTLLADLGLAHATVQQPTLSERQMTTLFWVNAAIGLLLTALCYLAAPLAAWFYGDARLGDVVRMLSIGFLFAGLSTQHGALLNWWLRFRSVAAISIGSAVISVLVALVLAWQSFGYWALVGQQIVLAAAIMAGNWICAGWRPGRPCIADEARAMLRFGGDVTGYNLLVYLARNADSILLGWRYGNHALGLYERTNAVVVAMPLRLINYPLSNVMVPALSRLAEAPAAYRALYLATVQTIAMATLPALALVALLAEPFVLILLGEGWTEAIPVFSWLAVAALTQPVGNTMAWLFVSQGRTRDQLAWGIIAGVVAIGGFVLGLPHGPSGVAAAYALSTIGLLPLGFLWATRQGPVRMSDVWNALAPGILAAMAVALGVLGTKALDLLPASAPIDAALAGGVALLVYAAIPSSRRRLTGLATLARRRVAPPPPILQAA